MTIKINAIRVQQALADAREGKKRTNGGWNYLEMEGRCLRYLGDPHYINVFLQAAQQYQYYFAGREDHLLVANLYRLSGDNNTASTHYQYAYTKLINISEDTKLEVLSYLDQEALCSYRLGLDDLCLQRVAQLQRRDRRTPWLNVYTLPYLIEAQRANHPSPAREAVRRNEDSIRKKRFQIWLEGSYFSPWDAYEEAQRVAHELGNAADAGNG